MDVFKSFDVIGSALTAERARLNAIESNVANANVTRGVDGGPYKRKDVILESVPMPDEFGNMVDDKMNTHVEVRVVDVQEDQGPPKMTYNPDHPDANAEGYVAMPNVNPVSEMVNMVSAERAYQANVNIFQTTKRLALKALEIGR